MKCIKTIAVILLSAILFTACQIPSKVDTQQGDGPLEYTITEGTETLIKYPAYPEEHLPRDYDYTVRIIQGDKAIELPVYNPTYASDYFNTMVYDMDQHRRYAEFAFTGDPVTVEITVHLNFDRYTIMPSSKAIPSNINENVITYTIDEPCTTVLKLNNDKDTHLTIFAEAPETEKPSYEDPRLIYCRAGYHEQGGVVKTFSDTVLYFGAGYHEIEGGSLNIGSNTIVYLAPGALVKARLYVTGQNVRIYGRGAFLESSPTRQPVIGSSYMCTLASATSVSIEDVRFLEAHTYNIVIDSCIDIKINGVKMLCNQISTDGLSVWGGGVYGMQMDNCYFNISDNVFVVGGGIQDFVVNDTIVISDYAFIFPQGKITGDPLVFKNIDVLRYNTFITHHYPNNVGNKSVDLVLENCTAIDSDRVGDFITSQYGGDAIKKYYLKNVSVQKINSNSSYYITTRSGSYTGDDVDNVSITFDNVWVGGEPISKELIASKDTLDYRKNNTVTYLDTVDESAVTIKRNDVILDKWVTPLQVYVGDLRIESKYQPYEEESKYYVSAHEILKTMLFEDIKVKDGKLTFRYGEEQYEIEVADEKAMVDINTLSNVIGTPISTMGNRINVTNIKRSDNLLRDPDFELGLSVNWVTRNFTNFYLSEDAQSGKYALRLCESKWGIDCGVYQDIADVIRQHGSGKYLVTAWVKKADSDADSKTIKLFLSDSWNNVITARQFELTDEWQKIEFTFGQGNTRALSGLMLVIGQYDGKTKNVLVDNVSMTKIE